MGTIVPKNLEDDFLLKNPDLRAESIVFYALKDQVEKEGINLNIFYDNSFISNWKDKEFDGQNDFICWSERGLIILEVKGGLLSCDDGKWFTTTLEAGNKNPLKESPFAQCRRNKYKVKDLIYSSFQKIDENISFEKYPIRFIDVLLFPDNQRNENLLETAEAHSRVLFKEDMENLVSNLLVYLSSSNPQNNHLPPNISLDRAMRIFKPTFDSNFKDYVDKINLQIKSAEKNLDRNLDLLRNIPRALFSGGAGTGKTYLALHKSEELENQGKNVLYVTSNLGLSQYNKIATDIPNPEYHYLPAFLAQEMISDDLLGESKKEGQIIYKNRKIIWDSITFLFNYLPKYSDPLRKKIYSIEYFQNIIEENIDSYLEKCPKEFLWDALIIDEAQDFSEKFITLLCFFLKKEVSQSEIFLFADNNQSLYGKLDIDFLSSDMQTFSLSENYRNTQNIKNLSYRFYKGEKTKCEGPEGPEVKFVEANSLLEMKRETIKLLDEFYKDGTEEIAILQGDVLPYQDLKGTFLKDLFPNKTNLYLVEKDEKLSKFNDAEEVKVEYPFRPFDLAVFEELKADSKAQDKTYWRSLDKLITNNKKNNNKDFFKYPPRKIGKYFVVPAPMYMQQKYDVISTKGFVANRQKGNYIAYDYISNFKGLESDIVILVDIDRSLDITEDIYVGLSRAKAQLFVISGREAISKLKELNSF